MTDRLTKIARGLRRRQTDDERLLWARLRDRRLNGLKFRRQVPCGPYVADFLCEAARLVIELDGSQHAEQDAIASDLLRTEHLKQLGYEVFRVWNSDFKTNPDGTLNEIVAIAETRLAPSSAPSGHLLPKGEGNVRRDLKPVGERTNVIDHIPSSRRRPGSAQANGRQTSEISPLLCPIPA